MKFISYNKRSKKLKHEYNNLKRKDFGVSNPVTQIIESKKIYKRHKWKNDFNKIDY